VVSRSIPENIRRLGPKDPLDGPDQSSVRRRYRSNNPIWTLVGVTSVY